MESLISLLPSLSRMGSLGYFLAFAIALAESLPFVGLMFPGTFIIILFGFFASQGYLHFRILVWFVTIGAILGDAIGYRFGVKGKDLFREGNRFLRPTYLEKGKKFFQAHGEKSVFLGRFIGPLRPIIPFVAGLSHMSWRRFLLWDVAVAILWSWSHIALGYFFGGAAAVIETWFTRASVFLILLVILLVLLWQLAKWLRPFFRISKSVIRSVWSGFMDTPEIRGFLKRHPALTAFMKRRFDRTNFSGLPLTVSLLAATYLISLLSGVIEGVVTAEPIVTVDVRVANLMYAFRDTGFIRAFLWITLLGRRDMVIIVMAVFSVLLVLWNRKSYILPFLVTVGGSQLFASLGKNLVHRPRPSIAYYIESSFSFPSGHAALATALYGFIAYFLLRTAKRRWRYRTLVLFLALATISAVGLSRLYLGVHFLSDVWGGHLLGALWLVIGISMAESTNRRPKTETRDLFSSPGIRQVSIIAIVAVPVLWYVYQGRTYYPQRATVDRTVQTEITDDVVGAFGRLGLPRYSETFSGTNQEPLSFIVVATDDDAFIAAMDRAGWEFSDPVTIENMTRLAGAAIMKQSYPTAPMTPSFWNTHVHDFGFQKQTAVGSVRSRHHARFWKAPIMTVDGESVYVGTASLDIGIKWLVTHRIAPDIDTERDVLLGDLSAAGEIVVSDKVRFVDPVLGKNFSGDPFFTDGLADVLWLKAD
ncbi:MAG: phosphatase PAP2 family protein [Candidatus Moranbacteria bacterium]|nr:phosphatase PAP2 family protein [Candidatus Moranbacteria bacterium]